MASMTDESRARIRRAHRFMMLLSGVALLAGGLAALLVFLGFGRFSSVLRLLGRNGP